MSSGKQAVIAGWESTTISAIRCGAPYSTATECSVAQFMIGCRHRLSLLRVANPPQQTLFLTAVRSTEQKRAVCVHTGLIPRMHHGGGVQLFNNRRARNDIASAEA